MDRTPGSTPTVDSTQVMRILNDFNLVMNRETSRFGSSRASGMPTRVERRLDFSEVADPEGEGPSFKSSLSPPGRSGQQWDRWRKEAELIEAKATIKKLESQLSRVEESNIQLATLEKELEETKYQHDLAKQKVEELYKQLKFMVDKVEGLNETISELTQKNDSQRHEYEEKMLALQTQCQQLEIELDELKNEKNDLLERQNSEVTKLSSELQLTYAELQHSKEQTEALKREVQNLSHRAHLSETLHSQLLLSQQKVKDLEDEISSQQEASVLARTMYQELNRLMELERETASLREENRVLKESGNRTLLLQEQLSTMQERYKMLEQSYQELLALQSENENIKLQLKAWESLGNKNVRNTPSDLSHQISQLQKNELYLTEKVGELNSNLHTLEIAKQRLESQNKALSHELEKLKEKNEEQMTVTKRLQKRMLLIMKERDSYKRVIDSYENEVTVNVPSLQMDRVRSLEDVIDGYRNVVEKLETEARELRSKIQKMKDQDQPPVGPNKAEESYEEMNNTLRNQLVKQEQRIHQLENEKKSLQERLNECQNHHEPVRPCKILHLAENPFDVAVRQRSQEMQRLKEENQKLKARVKILEEAECRPGDLTAQVEEKVEREASLPSIESLQEQLKTLEIKNKRLVEAFMKTSQEFREACYVLTGYRIDAQPQKKYRLSHIYAESPDDYLIFEQEGGGRFHLLETEYSRKLSELIDTYLRGHDSIPAFLASLSMDLFRQQTLFVMNTS